MRRLAAALAAAAALVIATWAAVTSLVPVHAQSGVSGAQQFHLIALNSTNAQMVSPGPHSVFGVQLSGIGSVPAYLKFYDTITTPVCNVTKPTKVLMIPAASTAANGGGSNVSIPFGGQFGNGIGICVTGGIADNDNTSVAAGTYNINFDWQ